MDSDLSCHVRGQPFIGRVPPPGHGPGTDKSLRFSYSIPNSVPRRARTASGTDRLPGRPGRRLDASAPGRRTPAAPGTARRLARERCDWPPAARPGYGRSGPAPPAEPAAGTRRRSGPARPARWATSRRSGAPSSPNASGVVDVLGGQLLDRGSSSGRLVEPRPRPPRRRPPRRSPPASSSTTSASASATASSTTASSTTASSTTASSTIASSATASVAAVVASAGPLLGGDDLTLGRVPLHARRCRGWRPTRPRRTPRRPRQPGRCRPPRRPAGSRS